MRATSPYGKNLLGLLILFAFWLLFPFHNSASAPKTLLTPSSKNPHLASVLNRLIIANQQGAPEAQALALQEGLYIVEGKVQVIITTLPADMLNTKDAIQKVGGLVTGEILERGWLQAWVPIPMLATLAAEPVVQYIDVPEEARPADVVATAGFVTTPGLAPMNAGLWHVAGYRGQGVKIGVIDIGFAGYTALLGKELPNAVIARNFVDGETDAQIDQGDPHGTAVAEIIHDVAPEATLYLAKIRTHIDLAEAVVWLVDEANVDVINTSLVWYTRSPGDGTGYFADLVTDAREKGTVWVTAAGNQRLLHWSGDWQDANGNGLLDFVGEDRDWVFFEGSYLLPPGMLIEGVLRWSDWDQVDQDIDFCLFHVGDGLVNEIDCSENPQQGKMGQTPTEYVRGYTADYPRAYGFYVRRISGNRPVHLDLFVFGADTLSYTVPGQSLANLADSPDAITVGAVFPEAPYEQPGYSAEGPTKGPGGIGTGGLLKPDLAAYTDAPTVSQGLLNGTSAATPHVSGAVALLLSAYPAWGPDQVEDWLFAQAVDHGAPRWDPRYGHGRLFLGSPPTPPPTQMYVPVALRTSLF